jgi:mono/diheme cytochrome c family protein
MIRFAGIFVLAGAFLFGGCKSLPPSKPLDQLTPQEASGHAIYIHSCARCHNPNSTRSLNGPGLQALYKQPYMPSGAPANDDRVTAAIVHGRNMMPATSLDERELADLLSYLHTL